MGWGYSLLEPFWRRKEKIEIMKQMNNFEIISYWFLYRMMVVVVFTIPLSMIFYLLLEGRIDPFILILSLVLVFICILLQVYRRWIVLKYKYHKEGWGLTFFVFCMFLMVWGFANAIKFISDSIPLALSKTYLQLINHVLFLMLISFVSFKIYEEPFLKKALSDKKNQSKIINTS